MCCPVHIMHHHLTRLRAYVISEFHNAVRMQTKQWKYFEETLNRCQVIFSHCLIKFQCDNMTQLGAGLLQSNECLAHRCNRLGYVVGCSLQQILIHRKEAVYVTGALFKVLWFDGRCYTLWTQLQIDKIVYPLLAFGNASLNHTKTKKYHLKNVQKNEECLENILWLHLNDELWRSHFPPRSMCCRSWHSMFSIHC